jgi:LPXTG-motif cell wall-anchored protein
MLMLAFVLLMVAPVSADVPSVALSTTASGGDTILVIMVTHQNPTASHRIDQIEVEVTNGSGSATYLVSPPSAPQSVSFTVTFNLGSITEINTIQSRANCNVHGWSDMAILTLNPQANVPSAPRSLQIGPGDRQASLIWQPSADDGGSSVTSYRVYRGISSGAESLLTTLGNVQSFVDTDLINNQTYYYKVSAVNAAGESALSMEVSVTPSVPTSGDTDQTFLIVAGIAGIVIVVALAFLIMKRKK